jgi:hypothetical protein
MFTSIVAAVPGLLLIIVLKPAGCRTHKQYTDGYGYPISPVQGNRHLYQKIQDKKGIRQIMQKPSIM